ncbi:MAG: MmgE/PrpD family protein [Geodermatophilaceae bacterium]|nr:MmgE/PrpD family protein [Geodermatophilaceae bacterium]
MSHGVLASRSSEQYFKPYPVCRWAHPAIDAALELRRTGPVEVVAVEVVTFHEAVQRTWRRPVTTEQAQYSLPFPFPFRRGGAAARRLDGGRQYARRRHRRGGPAAGRSMTVSESAVYSAAFPDVRSARVTLTLADGVDTERGDNRQRGRSRNP